LAFRNARNLRRRLVNKDPKTKEEVAASAGGFKRCSTRCAFCKDVKGESVVKTVPDCFWNKLNASDARRGRLQSLKIPASNCDTKNLVYLCGCTACGVYYVGKTGDTLNKRCSKHRSQPADAEKFKKDGHMKDWSEVRCHFVEHEHRDSFWVAPLEVL
jgi:hypothetical protein